MQTRQQRLNQAINRILAPFRKADAPELLNFVSGVTDASAYGAIDDGAYGDPLRDTRPDFVKKDDRTWD